MNSPEGVGDDGPVLAEIRELAGGLSDERTKVIFQTVLDAVALNPQPIPPGIQQILQSVIDAIALNPQPLPPEPPPGRMAPRSGGGSGGSG